jgi:hypothetical protein
MLAVAAAFLMIALSSMLALLLLVAAAILLDSGVTPTAVGQHDLLAWGGFRGRLNGLYTASFFAGSATARRCGRWAYADGGWTLVAWIGFCIPIAALLCFMRSKGASSCDYFSEQAHRSAGARRRASQLTIQC